MKKKQVPDSPEIKSAPKDGPSITIRLRTEDEHKRIVRAAKNANLSQNTWIVEVLSRASEAQ